MARKGKFTREEADIVSSRIYSLLYPYCENIVLCGSYRRNCDTVGDLDFVIVPKDEENIHRLICSQIAKEVLAEGSKSMRVIARGEIPIQLDFMIVSKDNLDSAVLHSTGSKWFNIKCRQRAQRLGLRLSQYGLLNEAGEKMATTEIGILAKIGMSEYSPPETRSM